MLYVTFNELDGLYHNVKYYKLNKDICVSVVTVLTETPVNDDDSEIKRHVEQLSLALDVIKNEYDGEHARVGVYEGRTGVLITLAGALLVFIGQSYTLPKHDDFYALIIVITSVVLT